MDRSTQMRRAAMLLLCLGLGGAVGAQQPQATFKSGVTLVTVDVSVLDQDGKPVPGLTAADFEIKLNGKVQPVRAVSYLQAASTPAGAPLDAQGLQIQASRKTVTNAAPSGEQRLFVLLIDDVSFTPGRGKGLFVAAQKFVRGLGPTDLVGFTTTGGGTAAVNPTSNRAAVLAALGKAVGTYSDPLSVDPTAPIVGLTEAIEIDLGNDGVLKNVIARDCGSSSASQNMAAMMSGPDNCASDVARAARRTAALTRLTTAQQMSAFEQVMKAMSAASGIKHLVVLTNGLGVTRDISGLEPVARTAAAAGVQMSILVEDPAGVDMSDTGPLIESPNPPEPMLQKVRRDDGLTLLHGMQTVADMSGGNVFHVIGTADRFFDRVAAAASAIYRLGVEEPANAPKGKDFTVSARVARPGLIARANRTAVPPAAEGPAPVMPVEDQLMSAVSVGASRYGVPISLATALRHTPGTTQVDLGMNISIPATVLGPITTLFALVDDAGAVKSGRKVVSEPADTSAFRLAFSLPVSPGVYRLRVAAADASGAVGSLETVVSAKLAVMGPFTASDLLTSWIGRDDKLEFLALEDVPPGVKTLNTTLELYPAADAPVPDDVRVTVSLLAAGQSKPVFEKDIEPGSGPGLLRADAEIPFDALAPGAYVLRARVSIGGKEVGSTSATIRKR